MGAFRKPFHCEPAPCKDKKKMCTTVLLLLFCYHVLSQPVTNEPSIRHARQLIECCPCPGSTTNGDQDMVATSGQFARADGFDDCPCRAGGADSEGASSVFFPSTVRADRPLMRSNDLKGDLKNLLQPEVALAASMLDTLREVTEEENQEAVARDAARSAVESNDAVPEESARNVVIIVNPKDSNNDDDFISETSHVQESRCIHPLASSPLSRMRSTSKQIDVLPETLKLSKFKRPGILHRNLLNGDSQLEASNVEESVKDINENTPKFQLRNTLFKTANYLESDALKNTNINNNNCDDTEPLIKSSSTFSELRNSRQNILEGLKFPLMPKLHMDRSLVNSNTISNDDLSSTPSNTPQELSEVTNDKASSLLRYKKPPLNLKQLLKLKDVELVPKHIRNKPLSNPKSDDLLRLGIPLYLKTNNEEGNIEDIDDVGATSDTQDERSGMDRNNFETCEQDVAESKLANSDVSASSSRVRLSEANNSSENQTGVEVEKIRHGIDNLQIKSVDSDTAELFDGETINENKDLELDDLLHNDHSKINADGETESNSNIIIVSPMSSEIQEKRALSSITSLSPINIENNTEFPIDPENNENIISRVKVILPLSENLLNLRENIGKELQNLKSSTDMDFLGLPQHEDVPGENKEQQLENFNNSEEPNEHIFISTYNTQPKVEETTSYVFTHDLQGMSDKLLDSSMNNENKDFFPKDVECEVKSDNINLNSKVDNDINHEPLISGEDSTTTTEQSFGNDIKTESEEDSNKQSENQGTYQKEMDTGASDTVFASLPLNDKAKLRVPLFEDIIVQPSNDKLSLIQKPLTDALNSNNKLPTLKFDDRLANIFDIHDKSVENGQSSHEIGCSNESTIESMAPDASAIDLIKKLPSLIPTKDFSVNMFQRKPLTSIPIIDSLSKSPRRNLHSYRTKVPIPSNLELKPIKEKSRVGDKAKMSTTSFLGSERKSTGLKSKPDLELGDHLERFFKLDELRNTVRSNTRNLLNSPVHPELNLFKENVRSRTVGDITEELRQNTKKTMKELERKMKSSLRQSKITNPLSETYAKPQEILDDVNDKFKAIHYDLNDRLSSFRDNILDTYNTVNQPKPAHRNVMTNLRKSKETTRPVRLQTSASSLSIQEVDPHRRDAQKDFTLNTPSQVNRVWHRPHHNAAESDPAFTRIEAKPTSVNPSLSHLRRMPMRHNPTTPPFLPDRQPLPLLVKESKVEEVSRPTFRNSVSSLQDQRKLNKVTISFGSTTIRPILLSQSGGPAIKSTQPKLKSPGISAKTDPTGGLNSVIKLNSVAKSRVSPSEFRPLKISTPMSSDIEEFENMKDNNLLTKKNIMDNFRSFSVKDIQNSNSDRLKSTNFFDDNKETGNIETDKVLGRPRVPGHSFLSKVRDAVNLRLSNYDSKTNKDSVSTEPKPDMLRLASENSNTVLEEEPLKENVSYRCRMVCTKESR